MSRLLQRLTATAVAIAVTACTPTRSTLKPPYPLDGTLHDETQIRGKATQLCAVQSGVNPEHPFTTDGCSVWPDSVWQECCIKHDIRYWCGGSAQQRKAADQELRTCVRERHNRLNAQTMYLAVRVWAQRLLPFPWRWGYGSDWPFRPATGNAESTAADQAFAGCSMASSSSRANSGPVPDSSCLK